MTPDIKTFLNGISSIVPSHRIDTLDSLRGLSVLGILLLNISSFGLPSGSAEDPALLQNNELNFYFWYIFGHGVFEGSFRAIFSMLFGASTLIFIGRLEQNMGGQLPSEYFLRRQLWLLMFGLFNAFVLLWPGDILFHYAVCGMVLVAFRSVSPKNLLLASTVCLLLLMSIQNKDFLIEKRHIEHGEAAALLDTNVIKLTGYQRESISEMKALKIKYDPGRKNESMKKEINIFRSNYLVLFRYQAQKSVSSETYGLYYFHFFDILVFMFMGMAFYKLGIFQGYVNLKIYLWMAVGGLIIGLSLSYLYLRPLMHYDFNKYEVIKHKFIEIYELQRYVRSIGVFGLIMAIYKSQLFNRLFVWMQPVGRMAFTNYLSQSFICAMIFYGCGLGMFGRIERYEMYYIVFLIWIILIVWSHFWLRYFRFGPIEWLWRSLTYWKFQPFKNYSYKQTV